MVVMDSVMNGMDQKDRLRIYDLITSAKNNWTLIVVSDDPEMINRCDKVIYLDGGKVKEVKDKKKRK
jgi:ABC-type bacteriocin/lantibiotic exporter with double-glycine peptidase domain